jgi:hypothetical protein
MSEVWVVLSESDDSSIRRDPYGVFTTLDLAKQHVLNSCIDDIKMHANFDHYKYGLWMAENRLENAPDVMDSYMRHRIRQVRELMDTVVTRRRRIEFEWDMVEYEFHKTILVA